MWKGGVRRKRGRWFWWDVGRVPARMECKCAIVVMEVVQRGNVAGEWWCSSYGLVDGVEEVTLYGDWGAWGGGMERWGWGEEGVGRGVFVF